MNPLLLSREWLIQPEALRSMAVAVSVFHSRGGTLPEKHNASPLLSVEDGIGVVSIEGPILRKPDIFDRVILGAASSGEIGSAIREAAGRDDIKAVMLDIDSPGGTVAGTPELAAAVASLNEAKPVYAFSSGQMCSAAYWIASQARAVYATPSAQVGSIGVVQAVVDDSAALAAEGIRIEVFAEGRYKSIGAPGTPLTDEQRELIRGNIGETAAEFRAAVLARGRAIPPEAMEGQGFSGRAAQRMNLAGLVPDRAEAMRRLRVYHAAVDTAPRAMSTAPEDLLLEARAQADALRRDHQAQTELLNEASANLEALRAELDLLKADAATLRDERDKARADAAALQAGVAGLQASQADFDKRLQAEVARVVASTGTTRPAAVTPAGDAALAADLRARFAAITDPTEQTAFWRGLTPVQQALVLKQPD